MQTVVPLLSAPEPAALHPACPLCFQTMTPAVIHLSVALPPFPPAQVHLLYLRSWQGMGQALLECAAGCNCSEAVLDGHWDREATLTDLTTLKASGCQSQLLREAAARWGRCQDAPQACGGGAARRAAPGPQCSLPPPAAGAPSCVPRRSLRLALRPWPQVSPHASCTLRLTLLNTTSSGGHLFSVSGVVVSSVDARMERGKIGQWEYDKQESAREAAKKAAAAEGAAEGGGARAQQQAAASGAADEKQEAAGQEAADGEQEGGGTADSGKSSKADGGKSSKADGGKNAGGGGSRRRAQR